MIPPIHEHRTFFVIFLFPVESFAVAIFYYKHKNKSEQDLKECGLILTYGQIMQNYLSSSKLITLNGLTKNNI